MQKPRAIGRREAKMSALKSCLSEEARAYYRNHFYEFVCTQIVLTTWPKYKPTWQQKLLIDAINNYKRIGCAAGHGPGKTAVEAWANIWFTTCFDSPCRVINTAPTGKQLTTVLWPEIHRWLGMSLVAEDLKWEATKIENRGNTEDIFSVWRTSDRPDNMQGFHAENMLWILDEAFGIIDPMIWEVIRGSMTGKNNKLFFAGNYTITKGPAHDAFSRDKKLWTPENNSILITLNAEESPIVDQKEIAEMRLKWGADHDVYRVRVLGLPPKGNADAYIKRDEVKEAIGRTVEAKGKVTIGLDCARKGQDLTCFCPTIGKKVLPFVTMPQSDEVQIYDKGISIVRDIRKEYGIPITEKVYINMDTTGGYGAGAYDLFLRNKTDNIEVTAISYSGGGDDECINTTSILWKELKEELPTLELPDDRDMEDEISNRNFTYRAHDGKDKLLIESKEDFKKRNNGVSPDRSDSLCLARAKKAIKKKVWSFFPAEYQRIIKIGWNSIQSHISPLISLHIDDRMNLSGLIAMWNSEQRKIFILKDFATENPHPDIVIPMLKKILFEISGGAVTTFEMFSFFGNVEFFDKNGGDIASLYRKYEVHIRDNSRYNESGAILEVARLITGKRLFVDAAETNDMPNVAFLPYEMTEWTYGSGMAAKGYGLCRALCNLASVLYEGIAGEKIIPLRGYSREKMKFDRMVQKNAKEKDIYSARYIEESAGGATGYML